MSEIKQQYGSQVICGTSTSVYDFMAFKEAYHQLNNELFKYKAQKISKPIISRFEGMFYICVSAKVMNIESHKTKHKAEGDTYY